jgi:hypothetical protein
MLSGKKFKQVCKEQKVSELKAFIELVISSLEGFIEESDEENI